MKIDITPEELHQALQLFAAYQQGAANPGYVNTVDTTALNLLQPQPQRTLPPAAAYEALQAAMYQSGGSAPTAPLVPSAPSATTTAIVRAPHYNPAWGNPGFVPPGEVVAALARQTVDLGDAQIEEEEAPTLRKKLLEALLLALVGVVLGIAFLGYTGRIPPNLANMLMTNLISSPVSSPAKESPKSAPTKDEEKPVEGKPAEKPSDPNAPAAVPTPPPPPTTHQPPNGTPAYPLPAVEVK